MQCHRLALGSAGCHRPRLVDLHSRILLQVGLSLPPAKESHSTFKEPTKESTAISAISSIRTFYYFFFQFNIQQIKEKNKHEEKPPFFDFTSLKSRTIQTIMVSTASIAAGIYTPLIYLVGLFFSVLVSMKIPSIYLFII
jgi:hypothetical protein